MALTFGQPLLPNVAPFTVIPADANLQFCASMTITASGYANNTNSFLNWGGGRTGFFCVVDIVGTPTGTAPGWNFSVLGSNDSTFTAGNVEELESFSWAPAAAQRTVPSIVGASIAAPDAGRAGTLILKPFWNFGAGQIVYQYGRLYVTAAGTTPSIVLTAWAAPWEMYYG